MIIRCWEIAQVVCSERKRIQLGIKKGEEV